MDRPSEWTVPAAQGGQTLAAFLRAALAGRSWAAVKRLVEGGKLFVGGERALDPARRLRAGERIELRERAPRPRAAAAVRLVHEDAHVVVIDKPAGVSSVPYLEREGGTAMDLVRAAWRELGRPASRSPLLVVHRIDKETSGLLVYAKSKPAEHGLANQFRAHAVARTYLCVAHGKVAGGRIESQLVADRGDGLRGSTRKAGQGKRAVTHLRVLELLPAATVCEVRLETGKTHQIRIHLAERGNPLVGEKVYIRDFVARGGEPLPVKRLLLHAATLGFVHPLTGERIDLASEPPTDFQAELARLRKG